MTERWFCATCGGRISHGRTWFHWFKRDCKPRHRIVPVVTPGEPETEAGRNARREEVK